MRTDYTKIWNSCLDVIRDNIPEMAFNTWFAPIIPLKFEENVLTIQVPSQFFYEYLEEKYIDLIQKTLFRVVGAGAVLNYRILVETENNTAIEMRGESKTIVENKTQTKKNLTKTPSPFDRVSVPDFDSQINSKYTFDNFFE